MCSTFIQNLIMQKAVLPHREVWRDIKNYNKSPHWQMFMKNVILERQKCGGQFATCRRPLHLFSTLTQDQQTVSLMGG